MRLALPLLAALALSTPAAAQMANALGKPLPDAKLDVGTVTIRVVDGSPAKPLGGVSVELVAEDGKSKGAVMRTNPEGRAVFEGLAPATRWRGKVAIEGETGSEEKVIETDTFEVPKSGGLRFMLSPVPLQATGAPSAGQPQMDPRRASGIPRADAQDPPGRLTVRVVRGEFHPTDSRAPVGAKIHLIGYSADGEVTKVTRVIDESERVVFDGLDTRQRVAYYALAVFERGGADSKIERLISQPISMPPRVGVRLLLSGEKEGSGKPAVDDLAAHEGLAPLGPGEARVLVGGQDVESIDAVELVEVGQPNAVLRAPLRSPLPSAGDVRGVARAATALSERRAIEVVVQRLTNAGSSPVAGVAVSLTVGDEPVGEAGMTNSEGIASLPGIEALEPGSSFKLVADVYGNKVSSEDIVWPKEGGIRVAIDTVWQSSGLEARFSGVAADPERVYLARLKAHGRVVRSTPFQMTTTSGASLSMLVFPGLIFSFHAGGEVDDRNFWFQAQLSLFNPGKEPYAAEGKIEVPLPRGAIRPTVDDEMSNRVQAADEKLYWRGALPPGPVTFTVSFALPVKDGTVDVDWPLPMGAFQSQMIIRKTPGLSLVDGAGNAARPAGKGPDGSDTWTLAGTQLRELPDREGRPLWVLSNLNIRLQERFTFGIRGLPQRPEWHLAVKVVVGVIVLMLLSWGVWGLTRAPAASAAAKLDSQRAELLEALAGAERRGDAAAAQKLRAELRSIYSRLDDQGG